MDAFEFAVRLRADVLSRLRSVQDAEQGMGWDTTADNFSTRLAIEQLAREWLVEAKALGLHMVRRHRSCLRDEHTNQIVESVDGIADGDPAYIWDIASFWDDMTTEKCPCKPSGKEREHWMTEEIVIQQDVDVASCRLLAEALARIYRASEQARHRGRRSAIREQLLRAVLVLNDAILPEPVEDYIKSRQSVE